VNRSHNCFGINYFKRLSTVFFTVVPSGITAQAANGMDFRELDKLNWRLHLSNNNNIVNYSANRHLGPDAAEERRPELLVSQVNCGTGVNTMGTNQKRAATTSAQAVAVDEQVVGAVGGGGAKAEECPAATMAAEDGDKASDCRFKHKKLC